MTSYHLPNSFTQEGVDHINISSQSKTHLGKLLDPSYFKVVNYPHIGKFNSVLNLWYWLKAKDMDDRLRKYTGVRLKKVVETIDTKSIVPNFKAIIAYATYLKLKDYPTAIQELKTLDPAIEFTSYYTPRGSLVRLCSNYAPVVVDVAKHIQQALLKSDEPDFDDLVNSSCDKQFYYLRAFLESKLGRDKLEKTLRT